MIDKDTVIFADKSFSDLLSDIYTNSKNKSIQITTLVEQLNKLIRNLNDAALIVPLIKEYLEVSVKNDEHLVKLAAIIQRLIIAGDKGSDEEFGLTEAEKRQLMSEAQELLEK